MKTSTALAALTVATLAAHAADSVVTFQNNVFTSPPRLVTFDASFGSTLSGTGVRNAVNGTASYVAQLFVVGAGGIQTPAGARANFRIGTSPIGVWSGSSRILAGVAPGTPVNLVVKVWDAAFPTYDAAVSAYWSNPAANRSGFGQSAVFSYTQANPVLLPMDTYMTGFSGFSITLPAVPEPSSIPLVALGLGGLLWLRRR